jgi:bacterioferritin-associated ferredoxin
MDNKKNIIICRCEDITLQQIDEALDQGFMTFEDLKRILRVGMGPCQANTCGHLIQSHIATKFNISIETVKVHKARPMLLGVKLKDIVEGIDQ